MAIQRQPHKPLFRIMDGEREIMRFRAKNLQQAKSEFRKQTARILTTQRLERYVTEVAAKHWEDARP